jgi:hypothetical protein
MLSMAASAMPDELDIPWIESGSSDGNDFVKELVKEFNSETYPAWLAQLPDPVQTWFITRWIDAVLDSTDLLGSLPVTMTALVLMEGSGGVTSTVAGRATFTCVHRAITLPCASR